MPSVAPSIVSGCRVSCASGGDAHRMMMGNRGVVLPRKPRVPSTKAQAWKRVTERLDGFYFKNDEEREACEAALSRFMDQHTRGWAPNTPRWNDAVEAVMAVMHKKISATKDEGFQVFEIVPTDRLAEEWRQRAAVRAEQAELEAASHIAMDDGESGVVELDDVEPGTLGTGEGLFMVPCSGHRTVMMWNRDRREQVPIDFPCDHVVNTVTYGRAGSTILRKTQVHLRGEPVYKYFCSQECLDLDTKKAGHLAFLKGLVSGTDAHEEGFLSHIEAIRFGILTPLEALHRGLVTQNEIDDLFSDN